MDAALLEISAVAAKPRLDRDRLRDILMIRLACADKALARDGLAKDLGGLVGHCLGADAWRAELDRDLAALADAGLVDVKPSSAVATEAGLKRAVLMIGGRGAFPKSWPEARDTRLMARALGMENDAPARLKALAKPDGLRAAILVKAFGLKLRGTPSPVKLRIALAKVALSRAFGDDVDATHGRSGLSTRAGRALAGRLAAVPRDFKTDARLIAALAAEQVHAEGTDLAALQLALLRRFVTKNDSAAPLAPRSLKRRASVRTKPKLIAASQPVPHRMPAAVAQTAATPAEMLVAARPTLRAFVGDVLALAAPVADGFVGNRRAFISRVWSTVVAQRPHWGLSEVEFKCMLAEAHRVGALVLAHADLKDGRNLTDIQASALSYKNAVFHYVRIDV